MLLAKIIMKDNAAKPNIAWSVLDAEDRIMENKACIVGLTVLICVVAFTLKPFHIRTMKHLPIRRKPDPPPTAGKYCLVTARSEPHNCMAIHAKRACTARESGIRCRRQAGRLPLDW